MVLLMYLSRQNSMASSATSGSEAKETREWSSTISAVSRSATTTRDFVSNISSVAFTNPDLIWVGKVEGETTVGALREANFLAPEYSGELTEEQIADIDAQTVTAGDWALISLKPFQSEESLVITMNSGYVYKIRVTDKGRLLCQISLLGQPMPTILLSFEGSGSLYKDGTG